MRDAHETTDSISKSTPLPDWLLKYHEWGCNNTEVPRYLISTYEAQALVFLARLVGAKRGMSVSIHIMLYRPRYHIFAGYAFPVG